MTSKITRFLAATFLLLALSGRPSQGADAFAPAQVLDFALTLQAEGEAFRAASEARRFLFLYPDHPRSAEARALLGQAETAPLSGPAGSVTQTDRPEAPEGDDALAAGLVRFYQNHFRTWTKPGSSCPSYPHCSAYAIQAMKKHGSLLGTFIFVDRFWREVTTAGQPPFVWVGNRKLHYDPLELNDYWLTPPAEEGR